MAAHSSHKILVIGATGGVGSAVSATLIERGVPFRAAIRNLNKANTTAPFTSDKAKGLVEFVEVDFYNPATLEKAFHGIEKVFLMTPPGQTGTAYPMVEAAKKAGVKYIVKLSALGADETPERFLWGSEHGQVEQAITKEGIAFTSLRPGYYFTNGFGVRQTIKEKGAMYAALGDAKLSMIDPRDIAEVVANCLTQPGHEGKIYNLCGPDNLSYFDLAQIFSEVIAKPVTYTPIDDAQLREMAKTFLKSQSNIDGFSNMMGFFRNGGYNKSSPDLERVLGHKGRTFRAWIEENAPAFK